MLEVIILVAFGVLLLVWIVMARQLWYAARHFTPPHIAVNAKSAEELPSVTVCVPARNERHALTDSLEAVLASTYPKLEIIVLDDVSVDDTSVLIKSFAHAGVRFVKGEALPTGWIGRNHALQELTRESSGTFIFFMDADTRIGPETIERLVRYALSEGARMVSVLPRRNDGWRASVLFSPLRYFWELLFHRRHTPASSSSVWLVERAWLQQEGGFESVRATIHPESKLAAQLARTNEYRFLVSSAELGVAYEKKWRSQLATSIRLLFPLLKHDVGTALTGALDLLLLLVPLGVLLSWIWTDFSYLHILAAVLLVGFMALYGWYTRQVWRQGWWLGALLWPVIVLQEFVLVLVSIRQHRRRAVTWKGRNVRVQP